MISQDEPRVSVPFDKWAPQHQVLSTLIERHHFLSRMSFITHKVKKRTGVCYSLCRFAPISSTRPVGDKASTFRNTRQGKLSKVLMRFLLKCLSFITNLCVDT